MTPWVPIATAFKLVALALDTDIPGAEACEKLRPRFTFGQTVERWKPWAWAVDWNGLLKRYGVESLRAALAEKGMTDPPAETEPPTDMAPGEPTKPSESPSTVIHEPETTVGIPSCACNKWVWENTEAGRLCLYCGQEYDRPVPV
jgi:hypothetical protein